MVGGSAMYMSENNVATAATTDTMSRPEVGGSDRNETVLMLPAIATKSEDFNENIENLSDSAQSENVQGLSIEAHDNDTESLNNIIQDNRGNECLSNVVRADNNDNEDLIKMGLSGDNLEPHEVDAKRAFWSGEIFPENFPPYVRKCPDWRVSLDYNGSLSTEYRTLDMCLPTQKMYPHDAELYLRLTTYNRLCVIKFKMVDDAQYVKMRKILQNILSSFPTDSYTIYNSSIVQYIYVLCRYSGAIMIKHQEYGKIFDGVLSVTILSDGDDFKTRGYLYSTDSFGLNESPAVDEALLNFENRCKELSEKKRLYDEEIQKRVAELAARSKETQEENDVQDYDNADLKAMVVPQNGLIPKADKIEPPYIRRINPANIASELRKEISWICDCGETWLDTETGEEKNWSEKPRVASFEMAYYGVLCKCESESGLALKCTSANKIVIFRLSNAVDAHEGKINSKAEEIIQMFPPGTVSVYYHTYFSGIDIVFKYSDISTFKQKEFKEIFDSKMDFVILCEGDYWRTRGCLYSTRYLGISECSEVNEAVFKIYESCTEDVERKCREKEESNRRLQEILNRREKIGTYRVNCRRIDDTGQVSGETASTTQVDEISTQELDIATLILPNSSELPEPIQPPATKQQAESADRKETVVVTESAAHLDGIHEGAPNTTEDCSIDLKDLLADTGTYPEVTLADFGVTGYETIFTESNPDSTCNIIKNEKGKSINTDVFPYILKLITNWVLCEKIIEKKLPKNPKTNKNAKVNDPSTWGSFNEAVSGFEKFNADGIGFVLTEKTKIVVFDFDHVRNSETGEFCSLVQEILGMLPEGHVFAENSQSGSGVHLFFQCTEGLDLSFFSKNKMTDVFGKNTSCEFYTKDRYIAMTGNLISEKYADICPSPDVDQVIIKIYSKCLDIYNSRRVKNELKAGIIPAAALSRPTPKLSDDDVIRLACKNSEKFRKLAHKDISDYDNDDSRADAAFIYFLAFYTKDPEQLDRIYRRWPLARDKWDSPRGESTYGKNLIQQAKDDVKSQYYPPNEKSDFSISSIDESFSFGINVLRTISLDNISTAQFYSSIIVKIVAYVSDIKSFYVYSGKHWENRSSLMLLKQLTKRFVQYVLQIIERALKEAEDNAEIGDEEKTLLTTMKAYYGSFSKLAQRNKLIEDIQDELHHNSSEFDSDPYLLNTQNGVLDLRAFDPKSGRTEKLLPHDPKYMLTKIANVTYDESAAYKRFTQCVDEVMEGNKDKTLYLQKCLGYSLLGEAPEECLHIVLGTSTRNGKSLIYDSVLNMLGTDSSGYGVQIDPDTILRTGANKSGSQARPDIVRLRGARMILASEPARGSYLNEGLLKSLTGNDIQVARGLYQGEYISYRNSGSIFILSNSSPSFDDDSIFKSGRLRIISFNRHFSPEEQDVTLKSQFRSEEAKSTILNFCLTGLHNYFCHGLRPYMAMYEELEDYRYACDYTQQFLNENVEILDENVKVSSGIKLSSLRTVYAAFAKGVGFKAFGLKEFREDLIKHRVRVERYSNQYYVACKIKGAMDFGNDSSEDKTSWRRIVH